jgi:hypothetical protein
MHAFGLCKVQIDVSHHLFLGPESDVGRNRRQHWLMSFQYSHQAYSFL